MAVTDLEAEELCSSGSEDALVVETDPATATQKPANEQKLREKATQQQHQDQKRGQRRSRASKESLLPPGWILVKSKSKPGAVYYAHPATKRTQTHPPATMYDDLPEPAPAEAVDKSGSIAPADGQVDTKKASEEVALRKKKEAEAQDEELRRQAREEVIRKQRKREETLKQAEADALEETAEAVEVIRKAREKRALELSSKGQEEATGGSKKAPRRPVGILFDSSRQNEAQQQSDQSASSDSDELDLHKLRRDFAAQVQAESRSAVVFEDEPSMDAASMEALASSMKSKQGKGDKNKKKGNKKDKKKKAKQKLSKEEKRKLKKAKKMKKLKDEMEKAKKELKKSEKLIKKAKIGKKSSSSSSSASSSSS